MRTRLQTRTENEKDGHSPRQSDEELESDRAGTVLPEALRNERNTATLLRRKNRTNERSVAQIQEKSAISGSRASASIALQENREQLEVNVKDTRSNQCDDFDILASRIEKVEQNIASRTSQIKQNDVVVDKTLMNAPSVPDSGIVSKLKKTGKWLPICCFLAFVLLFLLAVSHLDIFAGPRRNGSSGDQLLDNRRRCYTLTVLSSTIREYLPNSRTWHGWIQTLPHVACDEDADVEKALAFLVAVPRESDCSSGKFVDLLSMKLYAANAIHDDDSNHCVLTLNVREIDFVQDNIDVIRFLRRCPYGVIILHGMESIGRGAAKSILPLLSEHGQYEDGTSSVKTVGMNILVLLDTESKWHGQELEATLELESFERETKALFEAAVRNSLFSEDTAEEETLMLSRALRRRLDFALPVQCS